MKGAYGRARLGTIAILAIAAFAIMAAAALTVSHAQLASSPWPMFHHDLWHTGLSPYDTSANPGLPKWAFANSDEISWSSAVIAPDRAIYSGSDDDNIYAVNPDGTLKWKFPTGGPIWSAPAIGTDGTIHCGSDDHNLYALTDEGQGNVTEKWVFATGSDVRSSPAIGADGTIYVGSQDDNLFLSPIGDLQSAIPLALDDDLVSAALLSSAVARISLWAPKHYEYL